MLKEILDLWKIKFSETISLDIPGSPERASDRFVVKDAKNRKYILEKHHFWNRERKELIAKNISKISSMGFVWCEPYLVSVNGKFIEELDNRCWMVQPYVDNDPILRPGYLDDEVMGKNCAELLIGLKSLWKAYLYETVEDFDLGKHTEAFVDKIQSSRHITRDITPIIRIVKDKFLPELSSIKKVFSHGDLHPLNILWKNRNVKAVIDWEFSGFRHEFTDVANLIGCLGFEHPTAFKRKFFISLMDELDKNDYFSREMRENLFLFVFGFRFSAWLNEWHKKNDEKMVELELDYLEILLSIMD